MTEDREKEDETVGRWEGGAALIAEFGLRNDGSLFVPNALQLTSWSYTYRPHLKPSKLHLLNIGSCNLVID